MIAGRAKIATLHPAFAPSVNFLMDFAEYNGVNVRITSAFRSVEDQARVCAQVSGPCATPGRSAHQFGLAVDLVAGASTNSAEHKWLMLVAGIMGFGTVANDPVHLEYPQWNALRKQLR